MEFGLSKEHVSMIIEVLSKTPISKAVIFGSRAKDNYKLNSDIDIAIFIDDDSNCSVIGEISAELDELPTPYQFDIVVYQTIQNEELKEHINRVGKTIYDKGET